MATDEMLGNGVVTSEPKPTDPDEIERSAREDYSTNHAALPFRIRFSLLYPTWRVFNATYFDNRLTVPRMSIGSTATRRLSETRINTDYGARTNIIFSERMMFGTDRRLIRTDDPDAQGVLRLIVDRLLGEMVKQCVMEIEGSLEESHDGYGPLYAREATRIGTLMGRDDPAEGLPEVHPRRRGLRLAGMPVAASWPHAYRHDGYYRGHVSFAHLRLRGSRAGARPRQSALPGVFEYLHFLADTGKHNQLLKILGRELDAAREARTPGLAIHENAPHGPTGRPLPVPAIDPLWLTWNGGCIRTIAQGIRTRRAFDGMPILADALQDAGCENDVILGHCRAQADHTANCWLLRLLTDHP